MASPIATSRLPEALLTFYDKETKITVRTETGPISSEGYQRSLKASLVFHFYMGYYLEGRSQKDAKGTPLVDQIDSPDNPKLGSMECEWYRDFESVIDPVSGLLSEQVSAAIHIHALTVEVVSKFPSERFIDLAYRSVANFASMNHSVVRIYAIDSTHLRFMLKHNYVPMDPQEILHLPGGYVTTRGAYIQQENIRLDSTFEHVLPCSLELRTEEPCEPLFHHLIADNYFVIEHGGTSHFIHLKAAEKSHSERFGSKRVNWVFIAEHPEKGSLKRWACSENPLHIFVRDIVDPSDPFEGKVEEKIFEVLLSYAIAIKKPIIVAPQAHFAFFLGHGFQVINDPEAVLLPFTQEKYLIGGCKPLKGDDEDCLAQIKMKVAAHLGKSLELIGDYDVGNWSMPLLGDLEVPEEVSTIFTERGLPTLAYCQQIDAHLKYQLSGKYLGWDPLGRVGILRRL